MRIRRLKLIWWGGGTIVVLVILWQLGVFDLKRSVEIVKEFGEETVEVIKGGDGFNFDENTPGYEKYLSLEQGCQSRDCIPAINRPVFESITEANEWLGDSEMVLAYSEGGVHRAYPQRILNWHEVVDDELLVVGDGGREEKKYIAVTFCPLCGSAAVFGRRWGEEVLNLGVSGKLENSCLVMYERESRSLWRQVGGEAIVGELRGAQLVQLPMDVLGYGEWKSQYPNGEVLSKNTGFSRDYSRYPYGNYEKNEEVYFSVEGGVDTKVHPKTEVYGVVVGGGAKAYTKEALERETAEDGVLVDSVGGERLRLSYDKGEIRVENLNNKRVKVVGTRMFWFAWKAFYPETGLFD